MDEAAPAGPEGERAKRARALLTRALYGPEPEYDRSHAPWRALLGTDLFRARPGLTADQRVALSYERLHALDADLDSAEALAADPERLASLHEWTACVDSGLTTIAGIHYNLFLGSLLDHGRGGRDVPATTHEIGTFLCTELGHGNDAAALRTTATHDPATGGFVLHTPVPQAGKFMPNTGPQGGPKTAVVAARLVADGRDHGVFLFLVPLTGPSGPLPGISVRPLDHRAGSPVDHCLTSFDTVRLPASALLDGTHGRLAPDGTLTSATGSRRRRFLHSIGRVTTGKLCMSAAALGATRTALAVAVAHGHHREIAAPVGRGRVPVFALRSHHGPLIGALATAYAMTLLHREAVRTFVTAPDGERDRAARFAAVTKGWVTWQARAILTECRGRCGARGLFPANRLAEFLIDVEGTVTAEGDNLAVWAKAGAEMLLDHPLDAPDAAPERGELADPGLLLRLLTAVEYVQLSRARRWLRRAPSGDPLGRWNTAAPCALRAIAAHAERRAAQALLEAARTAEAEAGGDAGESAAPLMGLYQLFALQRVAEHSGDLLNEGYLAGRHVSALPEAVEARIPALAPWAETLAAAFDLPDAVLADIPLARGALDDGLLAPGGTR
ncbi:hypothetical protein GCM10027294_11890 [Marinactinospora endophytica]